jgi:hypothetical protein
MVDAKHTPPQVLLLISSDLIPHKRALSSTSQSSHPPPTPIPIPTHTHTHTHTHTLYSCTMNSNIFEYYPNTDEVQDQVVSAASPNPPWAMGDYSYASESVPQSTRPSLTSTSGPYLPDFDTTDYAAFLGVFANIPTRHIDYTYPVSS